MTAYKTLKGQSIRQVASDPTNPVIGEIWYNTNMGSLKAYVTVASAWASGGNLNTARYALAGAGTQTAGLAFSGYDGTAMFATAEEYNGSSWSNGGNMGTARYRLAGLGTQTAALGTRGFAPAPTGPTGATEEYDGSSWTAGGLNPVTGSSSSNSGATGTQTAGLNFGGSPSDNSSHEYNGSSWTTGGNLNTGRSIRTGAGTQTAGLAFGNTTATEGYNGTSWTTLNSLTNNGEGGNGDLQTAAIAIAPSGATETWDGTNWSSSGATAAVPRSDFSAAGTKASALKFGGNPPITNSTEEFTAGFNATRTITTS